MGTEFIRQNRFDAGEVGSDLHGRSETAFYARALRRCRNFIPRPFGPADNRAGFVRGGDAGSNGAVRLRGFALRPGAGFMLEFSHLKMRVWRTVDGVPTLVTQDGSPYTLETEFAAGVLPSLRFLQHKNVLTILGGGGKVWELTHTDPASPTAWTLEAVVFSRGAATDLLPPVELDVGGDFASLAGWMSISGDDDNPPMPWEWRFSVQVLTFAGGTPGNWKWTEGRETTATEPVRAAGDTHTIACSAKRPVAFRWGGGDPIPYPDPDKLSPLTRVRVHVYKGLNGHFGHIGQWEGWAGGFHFVDNGLEPNYGEPPRESLDPWAEGSGPNGCAWWQQRIIYAGGESDDEALRVHGARIGDARDFQKGTLRHQAFDFELASTERETLKHALALEHLLLFSTAQVWSMAGAGDQSLGPDSVDVRPRTRVGCGDLEPLKVGASALFTNASANAVHDVAWDAELLTYPTRSVSAYNRDLLRGHRIVSWAYAARPYSMVWAVRDDGLLLGLVYDPSQDVLAWSAHPTAGTLESVATLDEDGADALWTVTSRKLGSLTRKTVERQAAWEQDPVKGTFLDCASRFDYRRPEGLLLIAPPQDPPDPGHPQDRSQVSYAAGASFEFRLDDHTLEAGDVGRTIILDPGGANVTARVTAVTGDDSGVLTLLREAPPSLRVAKTETTLGTWITNWAFGVTEVAGLTWLSGATVDTVLDGQHVPGLTVAAGVLTLPCPAAVVLIGLPYEALLEPLDVSPPSWARGKRMSVAKVVARVTATRGLWAGETDSPDDLREWDQWTAAQGYATLQPVTAEVEISIGSSWNTGGRAVLLQRAPFGCSVLELAREVSLG
jgi:hypothetical protein